MQWNRTARQSKSVKDIPEFRTCADPREGGQKIQAEDSMMTEYRESSDRHERLSMRKEPN
jgi:hypothetical protein